MEYLLSHTDDCCALNHQVYTGKTLPSLYYRDVGIARQADCAFKVSRLKPGYSCQAEKHESADPFTSYTAQL